MPNKTARQVAALSEIRSGRHDWRYLLGAAGRPVLRLRKAARGGEGYYRLNLHAARVVTVCDRCRTRV